MRNHISELTILANQYPDGILDHQSIIIDATTAIILTLGGETTPDIIAFLPEFMKMPNYSLIGMDINTAADLENVLQTPRP